MQILKKSKKAAAIFALLLVAFALVAAPARQSLAACNPQVDPDDPACHTADPPAASSTTNQPTTSPECQNTDSATKLNNCLNHSKIVGDLQTLVNVLAAGVGIVTVGVVILGGIQYSIAGDNASAVAAARQRIINAMIALVAFIFMFAFLNYLIPGGVFG